MPDASPRQIAASRLRTAAALHGMGDQSAAPPPGRERVQWSCSRCHNRVEDERPASAPPGTYSDTILCARCAEALDALGLAVPTTPAAAVELAQDQEGTMPETTKVRGGPKRLSAPWTCQEHGFASDWPPAIASHKLRLHGANGATPPAPK
ncbi:MAG: hypothetical protein QME96_04505, partial [Myxococcota bacterium]|nr:hypothetical protein [Myxococcota bacterium]